MKSWLLCVTLLGVVLTPKPLQETRFEAVELWIETGGDALAAWQIELSDPSGRARIVAIEGGEHAAFRQAPYFDSRAIDGERVLLAAFSLSDELPRGETRVARIHFQVSGEASVDYATALQAAASADGVAIEARLTIRR